MLETRHTREHYAAVAFKQIIVIYTIYGPKEHSWKAWSCSDKKASMIPYSCCKLSAAYNNMLGWTKLLWYWLWDILFPRVENIKFYCQWKLLCFDNNITVCFVPAVSISLLGWFAFMSCIHRLLVSYVAPSLWSCQWWHLCMMMCVTLVGVVRIDVHIYF